MYAINYDQGYNTNLKFYVNVIMFPIALAAVAVAATVAATDVVSGAEFLTATNLCRQIHNNRPKLFLSANISLGFNFVLYLSIFDQVIKCPFYIVLW